MNRVEYLYWDLGSCAGGTSFEVELDGSAANVFLVDRGNFSAYQRGRAYQYYGGFFDYTPLTIEVPYKARWYLVVDGYDDDITVTFEELD
ncbi:DUF1883 domain-containing protein [Actinosynnema sp. NPDC059335]|uniref:DUF1883 domain-containing protein n=1 Tax=Actinosynnema sp. NPDC059335 TaxID=3346804 RepID=UPI003671F6A8